jgi:uncharacterized membrane protein YbhN (UPF0104 family)
MLGLFVWFVTINSDEFAGYVSSRGAIALIVSAALVVVSRLLLVRLSLESLKIFAIRLSFARALWIYSLSQLGKFLPGNIWQFVGRIFLYRQEGVPAKDGPKLLLIESFWIVGSAVTVGVVGCAKALFKLSNDLTVVISLVVMVAWLVVLHIGNKFLVKQFGGNEVSTLGLFALQVLIWFALGMSFWILLPDNYRIPDTAMLAVGAFALGWSVGAIVPFAPAGLGVREAAIVAFMAGVTPVPVALAAAAVNRLIYTAMDLALGTLAAERHSSRAIRGISPSSRTEGPW